MGDGKRGWEGRAGGRGYVQPERQMADGCWEGRMLNEVIDWLGGLWKGV